MGVQLNLRIDVDERCCPGLGSSIVVDWQLGSVPTSIVMVAMGIQLSIRRSKYFAPSDFGLCWVSRLIKNWSA